MKMLQRLFAVALLLLTSGVFSSCSGFRGTNPDPFPKPDPMATGELKYLQEKAEAGLAWKTRAEEMVRQSKATGTYEQNSEKIQQAYSRVDTSLQVWVDAVTTDSPSMKQSLENQKMRDQIEDSLAALSVQTGVPATKGWKRDLVVVLLKSLFPPTAFLVDHVNSTYTNFEATHMRQKFRVAHQLVPTSELKADPDT